MWHGTGMILEHSENTVKVGNLGRSRNGGCECTLARVGAVIVGGGVPVSGQATGREDHEAGLVGGRSS